MAGGSIISASPAGGRSGAATAYGGMGGGWYPPQPLIRFTGQNSGQGGAFSPPGGGGDGGGGGLPPAVGAGGGFVYPAPPLAGDPRRPRPRPMASPTGEGGGYAPGKPLGKQQIVNPSRPVPPSPLEPNQVKPMSTPPLGAPPAPKAPGLVPMNQPARPTVPGPRPTPRPMGPQFMPAGPPGPPTPTVNPYGTKPTFQTTPNYGPGFNMQPSSGTPQGFTGGTRPGTYQPPPLMIAPPPPPGSPLPPDFGGGGGGGGGGDYPGGPGAPGGPGGPGGGDTGGGGDGGGGGGNTGGPPAVSRFGALPGMRPQTTDYSPQQRRLLDQIRGAILRTGTGGAYGDIYNDAELAGQMNFGQGLAPGRRPMMSPVG